MAKKETPSTSSCEDCRVTDYARKVVSGEIVAGPHVRASGKRHLDDLKNAHTRGIYFDSEAASRVYRFFETVLRLNGGQFEGRPFLLEPSQSFMLGSLFGWYREDGTRRYRRAYVEQGKGNGKSPFAAGIGLYGLIADGEQRAEIYAAASKREQAMVLFRDARAMVEQSRALNGACLLSGGDHQPNIAFMKHASFFRPISREKGQSGPRPSMALCDEVHEHPSRDTIEMLERGFKFRLNPLLFMISNSGFDKTTVCWEEHAHAVKVAHGEVEDDSSFSYVCALDDGDDPLEDPSCWIKANPLLGVTITESYLQGVVDQAKAIPGKRNNILRLHFCIWTDAESVWMSRETWEECETDDFDMTALYGQPCFGGLDLSAKRDLTALARVWKQDDGSFDAVVEFWTPADTMRTREDIDRVSYSLWREQGYLRSTPSSTVDYSHIVPQLGEMHAESEFLGIAYDRWRIDLLKNELSAAGLDYLPLQETGQGFRDMAGAVDALEEAILNKRLRVKFNPVLRWNVASAVLEEDAAGNRKFTKKKSTGRIDGVVALAMAMKLATQTEEATGMSEFLSNPVVG